MQNVQRETTQSSRPNSSNSIETQLGSMPPQLPGGDMGNLNGHSDRNGSHEGSPASSRSRSRSGSSLQPLHERRRLMDNAPTTLSIPSATTTSSNPPRPE